MSEVRCPCCGQPKNQDATFKEDIETVFRLIHEYGWSKEQGDISIQYVPQGETEAVVYRVWWRAGSVEVER